MSDYTTFLAEGGEGTEGAICYSVGSNRGVCVTPSRINFPSPPPPYHLQVGPEVARFNKINWPH